MSAMRNSRWTQRPEGSTWGDFGADDQIGRLNLLTPAKVKQGIAEVKDGLSFCLSLPLNYPGESKLNARRKPPQIKPTSAQGKPVLNFALRELDARNTDVICDDQVLMTLQYSTQWDSFAHVGSWFDADGDGEPEMVYYNGYRAHQHIKGPSDYQFVGDPCDGPSCAEALGIENFAVKAIQGRAVLVDLHKHFGDERKLIDAATLQRVLDADQVVIEKGDMVLLHTGFSTLIMGMNLKPDIDVLNKACPALDGRDPGLLNWITESGVVALCADNYAVEHYPAREQAGQRPALPLHQHCLFKLGVPLGELWWLNDLALHLRSAGRSRCLLTAPPLRLPGAVGSPVTPVATV
ncbi:MAG TPA: cyclase family protein [Burkholderiaceae bacterium]|nr:cyclase family protein [Burkholderiaceae bacterium]